MMNEYIIRVTLLPFTLNEKLLLRRSTVGKLRWKEVIVWDIFLWHFFTKLTSFSSDRLSTPFDALPWLTRELQVENFRIWTLGFFFIWLFLLLFILTNDSSYSDPIRFWSHFTSSSSIPCQSVPTCNTGRACTARVAANSRLLSFSLYLYLRKIAGCYNYLEWYR